MLEDLTILSCWCLETRGLISSFDILEDWMSNLDNDKMNSGNQLSKNAINYPLIAKQVQFIFPVRTTLVGFTLLQFAAMDGVKRMTLIACELLHNLNPLTEF